jgi:hypothetical protein
MPVPDKKKTAAAKAAPEPIRPRKSAALDPSVVVTLRPNEPFLLRHFFLNWTVGEVPGKGVFLLPDVDHQPVHPGTASFRTLKDGEAPELAYKAEVAKSKADGWTYIMPHDPDDRGGGYVLEVDCAAPTGERGIFYHDPWTKITPSRRAGAMAGVVFDHAAFNLYRYNLVANGVIDPPDEGIRAEIVKRYRKHAARGAADWKIPEQVRSLIEAREAAKAEKAEAAKVPGREAA